MILGCCPACNAEYPDFHSPVGSAETLCDACGWCSDEDALYRDLANGGNDNERP